MVELDTDGHWRRFADIVTRAICQHHISVGGDLAPGATVQRAGELSMNSWVLKIDFVTVGVLWLLNTCYSQLVRQLSSGALLGLKLSGGVPRVIVVAVTCPMLNAGK